MRTALRKRAAIVAAALLPAVSAAAGESRDLHFGEALYHAHQGHYFEALERLDSEIAQHYRVDEPQRDSLQAHIATAETAKCLLLFIGHRQHDVRRASDSLFNPSQ